MPVEASPVRTLEVDPPLATAMGMPRALAALATATTGSMVVTCARHAASCTDDGTWASKSFGDEAHMGLCSRIGCSL